MVNHTFPMRSGPSHPLWGIPSPGSPSERGRRSRSLPGPTCASGPSVPTALPSPSPVALVLPVLSHITHHDLPFTIHSSPLSDFGLKTADSRRVFRVPITHYSSPFTLTDELMNERASLSSSLAETACLHGLEKGESQNEGRRSGHLH